MKYGGEGGVDFTEGLFEGTETFRRAFVCVCVCVCLLHITSVRKK